MISIRQFFCAAATGTYMSRYLRVALLILGTSSLSGCFVSEKAIEINLGSVSVGQQLIDLKKARDSGAITGSEYRQAKADFLQLAEQLNKLTNSDSDDDDGDQEDDRRQHDDQDEDDDFIF